MKSLSKILSESLSVGSNSGINKSIFEDSKTFQFCKQNNIEVNYAQYGLMLTLKLKNGNSIICNVVERNNEIKFSNGSIYVNYNKVSSFSLIKDVNMINLLKNIGDLNESKDNIERYNWDSKLSKGEEVKFVTRKNRRFTAIKGKIKNMKDGKIIIVDKNGKEYPRKKPQKVWTLNERVEMMKKIKEKFGSENMNKLIKAGELWLKDNYKTWKASAFEDFYDDYRNDDTVMKGFAMEEFFAYILRGNTSIYPYLKKAGIDIKKLNEQKEFSIKNKNYDYSKFDQEQLNAGIEIEKEHTDDETIAKQVAADHLSENPDYYKILKKNKIEEVIAKEKIPTEFRLQFFEGPSDNKYVLKYKNKNGQWKNYFSELRDDKDFLNDLLKSLDIDINKIKIEKFIFSAKDKKYIKNIQEELSLTKILNESAASDEAKKKGLTHKGYGKWADKSGAIVAQTKGDKLVPVKNTTTRYSSSAGDITKAVGPKASKKFLSKTKTSFNPLLKTNNIKYGEYVILKNGNRYRKETDSTFRNMDNPKDIRFVRNLDIDSPISHGETADGNKKQAQRYDIDKEYNWNKKVQSSNSGDIITDKNGKQFIVKSGWGNKKIAEPYSKFQQDVDTGKKKEPVKKDNTYSDAEMKDFKKQQADIPIGIKKEDPETQKYKINNNHIDSLNNQAMELINTGKKKEGLLILNVAKSITKYGNYISKKQAKLLHSLGAKLNWK